MTLFVIGTRPEAIKLAPLILNFKQNNIKHIVLSTGQHADMVADVLNLFDIKIDVDFKIMKENQSLSFIIYQVIKNLESMFSFHSEIKNVVVHGDTSTAFAASIWAFQNKLNIIHIEAGLRTSTVNSPFPEEANRRCISQLATFSFCPTPQNKNNMLRDNIKSNIFVVGNTIVDAVDFVLKNYQNDHTKIIEPFAVLTTHRRENIGHHMESIFKACNKIAKEKNIIFYFPMHPNPKIKEIFDKVADKKFYKILKPQKYNDFINMLNDSLFVMTDSGGIQEECVYLRKPLFILREETERKEIIGSTNVHLVGTNEQNIFCIVCEKLLYNDVSHDNQIYGDGTTSKKIIDILKMNGIV